MRKRTVWTLALVVVTFLEVLLIGHHRVAAQDPAVTQGGLAASQERAAQIGAQQQPPSGKSSQATQRYYDYVFAHYLGENGNLRTSIRWTGPFWIAVWAAVLILFFFLYSFFFQEVHRERGELYGASSFSGSILERIGTVALLSKLIWTGTVLWGLYYIVTHILWGQVY